MKNISPKANKTKVFTIALFVILGLIFLNLSIVSPKVKNIAYSISAPIQKTINYAFQKAINSQQFLKKLKSVYEENFVLKDKIRKLEVQNIDLKELGLENKLLREYLSLKDSQRREVKLATVINQSFQNLEKYILIDKGSLDGLKTDMPVIVANNILIGRIVEAFDSYSKVLLLTSSNSKVPVFVQESRIDGLLSGLTAKLLQLDLIPKNLEIKKEETVLSSGLNTLFPRGLLVGHISDVTSVENEIFQKVKIAPAIDFKKIEKVLIILSFPAYGRSPAGR